MSEIIRDAYCRAVLENNPIPKVINTEYFEDILRQITTIFGKDLEDILKNFSLNPERETDDYLLEFTIKSCLPKNPLYQGSLVRITHSNSYCGVGSLGDRFYRLFISTKKENLKVQDPIWVWENKDLVDKFMEVDNPYYEKLKMVERIFPLEITFFE